MARDVVVVLVDVVAILILADVAIRMAIRVMAHYGISGGFVGLTVVSIGASLLEIATHVAGSFKILAAPDEYQLLSALLLGSNIGSDIVQQNLLLPGVVLVVGITASRRMVVDGVGALVAAASMLWIACLDGRLGRGEGGALIALYLGYLIYLGRSEHRAKTITPRRPLPTARLVLIEVSIIACFALIAILAGPLLDSASHLVAALPVSGSYFGVIALGVAAAVPELTTALAAARRGETAMVAGILVGSNVTNPLFAAGLGAAISTYDVPAVVTRFDLPVKVATGILVAAMLSTSGRVRTLGAAMLIASYVAYLFARPALFPGD